MGIFTRSSVAFAWLVSDACKLWSGCRLRNFVTEVDNVFLIAHYHVDWHAVYKFMTKILDYARRAKFVQEKRRLEVVSSAQIMRFHRK